MIVWDKTGREGIVLVEFPPGTDLNEAIRKIEIPKEVEFCPVWKHAQKGSFSLRSVPMVLVLTRLEDSSPWLYLSPPGIWSPDRPFEWLDDGEPESPNLLTHGRTPALQVCAIVKNRIYLDGDCSIQDFLEIAEKLKKYLDTNKSP